MKLGELVVAQEALQRLLALELPAATSFKLARAARPVMAELQDYEQQRIRLVQQFGEAEGQQVIVRPNRFQEFNVEINALLQVDVDVAVESLSPDLLDGVDVRAVDLMALWFLFKDEQPGRSSDAVG